MANIVLNAISATRAVRSNCSGTRITLRRACNCVNYLAL